MSGIERPTCPVPRNRSPGDRAPKARNDSVTTTSTTETGDGSPALDVPDTRKRLSRAPSPVTSTAVATTRPTRPTCPGSPAAPSHAPSLIAVMPSLPPGAPSFPRSLPPSRVVSIPRPPAPAPALHLAPSSPTVASPASFSSAIRRQLEMMDIHLEEHNVESSHRTASARDQGVGGESSRSLASTSDTDTTPSAVIHNSPTDGVSCSDPDSESLPASLSGSEVGSNSDVVCESAVVSESEAGPDTDPEANEHIHLHHIATPCRSLLTPPDSEKKAREDAAFASIASLIQADTDKTARIKDLELVVSEQQQTVDTLTSDLAAVEDYYAQVTDIGKQLSSAIHDANRAQSRLGIMSNKYERLKGEVERLRGIIVAMGIEAKCAARAITDIALQADEDRA